MSKRTMPWLLALILAAGEGGPGLMAQSVFYAKTGRWALSYRKATPDKLGDGSIKFYEWKDGKEVGGAVYAYDKKSTDGALFQPVAGKHYLMKVSGVAPGTQLELWLDDLTMSVNPFHVVLDGVVGKDGKGFGKFNWLGWKWNRVTTKPGLPACGYPNVFDAKDWSVGNLTVVVPAFAGMQ